MKAEEFDNDKEDIIDYIDFSTFRRPNLEPKKINIDFPTWMVKKLDKEAQHISVSRQPIINRRRIELETGDASLVDGDEVFEKIKQRFS